MIWTIAFWKGAGERAIKTGFQVSAAMLIQIAGTELIPAVGIESIPWNMVASTTALAVFLSLCTSIGNADFTAGAPQLPKRAYTE